MFRPDSARAALIRQMLSTVVDDPSVKSSPEQKTDLDSSPKHQTSMRDFIVELCASVAHRCSSIDANEITRIGIMTDEARLQVQNALQRLDASFAEKTLIALLVSVCKRCEPIGDHDLQTPLNP
ncbi:hypothetical protein BVRB_032610, partial [Beta vulgaris subsp. vulgaris]